MSSLEFFLKRKEGRGGIPVVKVISECDALAKFHVCAYGYNKAQGRPKK